MIEAQRDDFRQKLAAARIEMKGWEARHPTDEELRPYGYDLLLRSRVVLGLRSAEAEATIPTRHKDQTGTKPSKCQVRMSDPLIHVDTYTSGSVRGLSLVEKIPNGSSYPVPDGTVEVVEVFVSELHNGSPEKQAQRLAAAIRDASEPARILNKGKVAFTIYPDGQVEDSHGIADLPENVTLCHLTLLEIEKGLLRR